MQGSCHGDRSCLKGKGKGVTQGCGEGSRCHLTDQGFPGNVTRNGQRASREESTCGARRPNQDQIPANARLLNGVEVRRPQEARSGTSESEETIQLADQGHRAAEGGQWAQRILNSKIAFWGLPRGGQLASWTLCSRCRGPSFCPGQGASWMPCAVTGRHTPQQKEVCMAQQDQRPQR